MSTEQERLATAEQVLRDVANDLSEFKDEQRRTRDRLHKLEGTVRGLVLANDQDAKEVRVRQRRIEIRVQVLTVVVAVAAIAVPFITYALNH